jgi:hypothetical protein
MMQGSGSRPLHLTYCLNIHPGETWEENLEAIRRSACRVRDLLGWRAAFGLGLRLSARAARELELPARLREARKFLAAEGLYAFTVNGFPYGAFHGTRIKEAVYAPDWTTVERVDYTLRLARVLAELLPEGVPGSISTVPGTYRAWAKPGDSERLRANLARAVCGLAELEQATGRHICLALEPEPDCLWERAAEVTAQVFSGAPLRGLVSGVSEVSGRPGPAAEALLRRHLGVCLDTCHQSVLRDDPAAALGVLQDAGVAIAKIQVSAAPIFGTSAEALACARGFIDSCYLHQSCLTDARGGSRRFGDLPEAIAAAELLDGPGELRTHFHIPLVVAGGQGFRSSREELGPRFWQQVSAGATPHLEVETYTFGVLPPALRGVPVEESIAGELAWVRNALAGSSAAGPPNRGGD